MLMEELGTVIVVGVFGVCTTEKLVGSLGGQLPSVTGRNTLPRLNAPFERCDALGCNALVILLLFMALFGSTALTVLKFRGLTPVKPLANGFDVDCPVVC